MKLTGKQVKQVQDALLDGFPTKDLLRMMVRIELEERLEAIADGENLRVVAFNLVTWAEQQGRLHGLIQGAYSHNPGNEMLRQLVDSAPIPSQLPYLTGQTATGEPGTGSTGPASIDIFLSYNRQDTTAMRQVRETLRGSGLAIWTDEGLEAGTPSWRAAIEEAISQAKAMVVLLSPNAKASRWVDNEVGYAQTLDKRIFPILVAGDAASAVPINLIRVQWLDGRQDVRQAVANGLQPILLRYVGRTVAKSNPEIQFDWVMIPAGAFVMGSDMHQDPQASEDEAPQHRLALPGFCIARFPVTNAQYERFVAATGHSPPAHWLGAQVPTGKEDHPVVNVSWHDAKAFCQWAEVRLPTEAQWEKAARGMDGRLFPWGDAPPNDQRCNYDRIIGDTTPVGAYSSGDSPYGVSDMAGNVLEWTSSLWGDNVGKPQFTYPYKPNDGREDAKTPDKIMRVLRGGAFNLGPMCLRCAFRGSAMAHYGRSNISYRVVVSSTH